LTNGPVGFSILLMFMSMKPATEHS